MEEYTIYAGNIVYATRSTYDEALKVVEEQLNLIEKFGKPKNRSNCCSPKTQ